MEGVKKCGSGLQLEKPEMNFRIGKECRQNPETKSWDLCTDGLIFDFKDNDSCESERNKNDVYIDKSTLPYGMAPDVEDIMEACFSACQADTTGQIIESSRCYFDSK